MTTATLASFTCPTKVIFGTDTSRQLPAIVAQWGCRRIFLLVDPALAQGEFATRIGELLREAGLAPALFSDIEPDPSDTTVVAAKTRCREHQADGIVAIGGGSTIDVAKALAILMTNGGRIANYEGIEKFTQRPLPVFAIPTTAGTGSEVSGACVITDTTRDVKMAIRHAAWCPAQVAILDPEAVATLPAHVAVHAGIDAFVHAFESYLSKLATPFSDALNLHAMRLIVGSLRPFAANRRNTQAAQDMLCGSAMAAMSFGVTGLGNVHCMALPLGGVFHVPHGLANALCLPTVAQFNLIANPVRYAHVAEILGVDRRSLSDMDAARQAVEAIRMLCNDLDVPARLRDVGVTEDSLDELARRSYAADYNRWNPRHTTEADFRRLFRTAY